MSDIAARLRREADCSRPPGRIWWNGQHEALLREAASMLDQQAKALEAADELARPATTQIDLRPRRQPMNPHDVAAELRARAEATRELRNKAIADKDRDGILTHGATLSAYVEAASLVESSQEARVDPMDERLSNQARSHALDKLNEITRAGFGDWHIGIAELDAIETAMLALDALEAA